MLASYCIEPSLAEGAIVIKPLSASFAVARCTVVALSFGYVNLTSPNSVALVAWPSSQSVVLIDWRLAIFCLSTLHCAVHKYIIYNYPVIVNNLH